MKEDLPPLEFSFSLEEKPKSYRVVHRPGEITQLVPLNKEKTLVDHEQILREKFPRIYEQIKMLWGSQEIHDKMAHMLWNDVEGRAGFPHDVVFALMAIFVAHGDEFNLLASVPEKGKTPSRDTW